MLQGWWIELWCYATFRGYGNMHSYLTMLDTSGLTVFSRARRHFDSSSPSPYGDIEFEADPDEDQEHYLYT